MSISAAEAEEYILIADEGLDDELEDLEKRGATLLKDEQRV